MEQDDRQLTGSVDDCHRWETEEILAATTKSLVAIGAAAALNCHVCLRRLVPIALNNGILEEEVAAAIAVVREIRTVANESTDNLGNALVIGGEPVQDNAEPGPRCCCEEGAGTTSVSRSGLSPRTKS
jgi:hypothetical protein